MGNAPSQMQSRETNGDKSAFLTFKNFNNPTLDCHITWFAAIYQYMDQMKVNRILLATFPGLQLNEN